MAIMGLYFGCSGSLFLSLEVPKNFGGSGICHFYIVEFHPALLSGNLHYNIWGWGATFEQDPFQATCWLCCSTWRPVRVWVQAEGGGAWEEAHHPVHQGADQAAQVLPHNITLISQNRLSCQCHLCMIDGWIWKDKLNNKCKWRLSKMHTFPRVEWW